jgi:hypothetical protein
MIMTRRDQSLRPNDDALPSDEMQIESTRTARIEFDLAQDGPYLKFTMADLDATGLVDGDLDNGFYLAILPGEVWNITFTLSNNWSWRFDPPAISFKSGGHAGYYRILSQSTTEIVMRARSKHPNAGPFPEDDHPFNLYVIMDHSATKDYPMMIDPDVKNPPPDNRKSEPSNLPVPLA